MQSVRQYHCIGRSLKQQVDNELQRSFTNNGHISICASATKTGDGSDCKCSKVVARNTASDGRSGKDYHAALHRLQHIQRCDTVYFVTQFTEDGPFRPQNWRRLKKWRITFMVGAVGLLASGAAAFDSEVAPQAGAQYNVSDDIALLATALYMITFGIGTIFSGPLSETFGRNPVYILSLIVFMLFTIGSAYAPNVTTWLTCRAFMGLFGSPPAVTFGGSMSDMWSPLERVFVFPILAALTFVGPFLAPLIADFIATSPDVSWHFVEWLTLIFAGACCLMIGLFVEETYLPTLSVWKARWLRRITGDERYLAPIEINRNGLLISLSHNVQRPWVFLFRETIVSLFSLYLVIIYVILFGSLVSFTYIFGRAGAGTYNLAIYNLSQREVGLCYIPMNIGFILALLPCFPIYWRFKNKLRRPDCERVQPEEHQWYAMIGAPLLPISIFWLAFTSDPSIPIWSPLFASGVFGFATLCIFISCYQYIIDSYERYAASALVGMTVTRYVASAPILIASGRMYQALGVRNTLAIWGSIAAPMTVVPFWFYARGAKIRRTSRRATNFGTRESNETVDSDK